MVKRNKETTDMATEMREMRSLIERLFGELNARQDKFEQEILELKKCIESYRDEVKRGKMVESDVNASSDDHENSSMLQEQEKMKGSGKPLTFTYSRRRSKKKHDVSVIEDDDVNVPIEDLVTTTEENEIDMAISVDEGGSSCVTGYHEKQPLAVLMGAGGTSHNFINESLVDKIGCETFPIEPRTVHSDFGELVTSRVCKNFKLSLEGTVFNLKLYLLTLSSDCDMVLGDEWLGTLDKLIVSSDGVEFYFQGEKKFVCFNPSFRVSSSSE